MKYVLCDVDGVIIHGFHTRPPHTNIWSKNLEADLGVPEKGLIDEFFTKSFLDVLVGKVDLFDALNDVLPTLGYKGDVQNLVDYWFQKDSKLNLEFLNWVRDRKNNNISFVLATNQEHYRANYLWENLELKNHFDKMFYAAKIGFAKPDPAFFLHILDDIKVNPSDVCLIDDHSKNVEVARSLGMTAIMFNGIDDVLSHPFMNES